MKYKLLYISHSSSFAGGSILSLIYLLEKLDRSLYEPVVVSIFDVPDLLELLKKKGIKALYWPRISTVPHTTGGWYSVFSPLAWVGIAKTTAGFRSSIAATEQLISEIQPDLVHLNSVVLSPSAIACKKVGVKLVWHVRESVVTGHLGLRKRWLSRQVTKLADEAIFISQHDRKTLCPNGEGRVIPNFVDFKRFNKALDGSPVRRELCIPEDAKVILFFGGMSRLKGAPILLDALDIAVRRIPKLWAIFAGAITPTSHTLTARLGRTILPLLGKPTRRQEFFQRLNSNHMRDQIVLLPFRWDPERLIAASDLVVFPSTQPHFARPVIEAGAMGKPVVASRIGGVEELVEDGKTGILVPPNTPAALSDAICTVLEDETFAEEMGKAGYKRAALLYSAEKNVRKITNIYNRLLNGRQ